jgi:hypothetical protein
LRTFFKAHFLEEDSSMSARLRISVASAVLVAASLQSGGAFASITADFRAANTGPFPSTQHDNDFSWESLLVDVNGDGEVSVGDSIWGVASFESIGRFSGTPAQRLLTGQGIQVTEYTAIFATKVVAASPNAGNPLLTDFVMGPDALFNSVFGNDPGTMIAFFDDTAQNFSATAPLTGGGPVPPYANLLDPGSIFQVASDGLRVLEIGFTGAVDPVTGDVTPAGGEGWAATAPADPSLLPGTPGPGAGVYNASLNALLQTNGYAQFIIPFTQASLFGTGDPVQFSANGQIFAATGATLPIGDSADIFWQIEGFVPEPVSLIVWSGLIGIGSCLMGRRRV